MKTALPRQAGCARPANIAVRLLAVLAFAAPVAGGLFAPDSARAQDRSYDLVEFDGTVVPAREAVVTPLVDGWLQSITFTSGEMVSEGDTLFEFFELPAQLELDLAKAQRDAATAHLHEAEADLKRAEALKDRDIVARVQLEKAEAQRDIATANLAEAEARVGLAELVLTQMVLKAPFTGIVSAPMVRENGWQEADTDNVMAVVTQLDPIHVIGEVPYDIYAARKQMFDSDADLIDAVVLSIVLPDGTLFEHEGKLVSGGHTFDEETQKVTVWGEFRNPDRFLRPGLKVSLRSRVDTE
ncbi:efflux RND transporter periplasmic adaptor subunit [Oceanomicrobium pacificus]|uniref:Efflux RND transporter periplasmic adaptor subunit n=1 Tax=Oceanomicrobium pacificus TaxID=2692916 RepID=A0A6B0TTM1_9RHOB|nr:efflux RND transporter periplasmic adaptor subunit [Oceanomicrobium pacificus]MXU64313.1 efflux RND transporter periplasmic adaptor subunit [Oceanomicrobium pacificus]